MRKKSTHIKPFVVYLNQLVPAEKMVYEHLKCIVRPQDVARRLLIEGFARLLQNEEIATLPVTLKQSSDVLPASGSTNITLTPVAPHAPSSIRDVASIFGTQKP